MQLVRAILSLTILSVFAMSTENNAAKALHDLFDSDWEYQMQQQPIWASSLGDRRWNDQWSDESLSAIHARFEHSRLVLKELQAIDRNQLSPNDRVSYDVFEYDKKDDIESEQYKWYLVRTNTFSASRRWNGKLTTCDSKP